MIELKDACFKYDNNTPLTLHNINLSIRSGDYLSIVGTSGSGKSTLMSILGLINSTSSGQYLLHNTDVSSLTNKSIALLKNREIGFVYQNFNLLSQLSIYDNVCLPLNYNNEVLRKDYRQKVMEALEQVEMCKFANRKPTQLSGGQQQRVAIARALVNNPSLILADEPTGNLDSKNSAQIFELFEQLNQAGKTICLITHDLNYAQKAKRLIKINDGKLSPCN